MELRRYYVYILANRSHTTYVGVTRDLETRVLQHKRKQAEGFTSTYDITRLVYYEVFRTAWGAIEREKACRRCCTRVRDATRATVILRYSEGPLVHRATVSGTSSPVDRRRCSRSNRRATTIGTASRDGREVLRSTSG